MTTGLIAAVHTCEAVGCESETDWACPSCGKSTCEDHRYECKHCGDIECNECESDYSPGYCIACAQDVVQCDLYGCETEFHTDTGGNYCEYSDHWVCSSCWEQGNYGYCAPCAEEHDENGENEGDSDTGYAKREPGEKEWPSGGIIVLPDEVVTATWQDVWPIDRTTSLYRGMVEFYLLEAIEHNIFMPPHALTTELKVYGELAGQLRAELIAHYDLTFRNYADMAIGGELRYVKKTQSHKGGPLPGGDRSNAWVVWSYVRNQIGVKALADAAEYFLLLDGGGVGGERWASAARLLHARHTRKISPEVWVDRVFSLQHNSGSFLNKINWNLPLSYKDATEQYVHVCHDAEGGELIQSLIGPAQAARNTAWNVLLLWARPEVKRLWAQWWMGVNQARRVQGLALLPRQPNLLNHQDIIEKLNRVRMALGMSTEYAWWALDRVPDWAFLNVGLDSGCMVSHVIAAACDLDLPGIPDEETTTRIGAILYKILYTNDGPKPNEWNEVRNVWLPKALKAWAAGEKIDFKPPKKKAAPKKKAVPKKKLVVKMEPAPKKTWSDVMYALEALSEEEKEATSA